MHLDAAYTRLVLLRQGVGGSDMDAWVLILMFQMVAYGKPDQWSATSAVMETKELCEQAGRDALAVIGGNAGKWLCVPSFYHGSDPKPLSSHN